MKSITMKQIVLGICLLLLAFTHTRAQNEFNGGVFGGLTASQIDNDNYYGFSKLGFTAGAYVQRAVMDDLSWQLEIKFITRGAYKPATDRDPTIEVSHLNYVEIPLSLNYLFAEKFQPEIGIAPDVLISRRYEDENGLIDPSEYRDVRRFGLNVFGGMVYWINPSNGVGIRYSYSAFPYYKFDAVSTRYRFSGLFHNVLQLNYYYQFNR